MNENVTPENVPELGLGFWGSKTLLGAIELGVLTTLAGGAMGAMGAMDGEALRRELGHAASHLDGPDSMVIGIK